MEPTPSPIQRKPLVDYTPSGQWITEEDKALLRNHFKGNQELLMVVKKFLLPSYADPKMPFEFTSDAFVKALQVESLQVDEIKAIWAARQTVIQWIGQAFAEIYFIANQSEESEQQAANRRKSDSTR